ncbi:GGDEF domain-containing protein [Sulfurimonas sp.]|uniref:GGDEF domain-containing protein n=1 Tax=Sulfurimonas sp. TaxID=2022749 RepID=UPI002601523F|nr:GGDEF domain-containing protein [Sulfurimonas sp.]
MESRQKVITALVIIFSLFFISMIISTALNFRDYGVKTAENKAKLTAEIVKIGLTSHMVNGIMDQRDFFINQIGSVEKISELWIARSPTVIQQYGEGHNNETPRDKIDTDVLKSGKMESVTTEMPSKSILRVSIPYIATEYGTPNCMACHNAKEGEALGVVSMVMDISDIRTSSLRTVLYNMAITILTIILIFMVINRFIKPFVSIFYSIRDVMQSAYRGDYSVRIKGHQNAESKTVADMLNTMLEKLQHTFEELDKKVYVFIKNKNYVKETDPLININSTIERLSDIYKFKQTIENDKDLEDIYNRIASVLKDHFKLDDFTMTEIDTMNKVKKNVYSEKGCHCGILDNECRADRINVSVDSSIFKNSCELYKLVGTEHICMPYTISNELTLVLTIVTKNVEETEQVRTITSDIEDYITTARPAIVSKKLMQTLNQMARVDQLTGMYNRKFLDEFADVSIPQAVRAGTSFGVLMIDIDYFKMINDNYGHDVGDEAIRMVSGVIRSSIRKADMAIRYGGEEFLVLLYNCEEEKIVKIAETIRVEFSKQKIYADGESFSKTLSVGCSNFPKDSDSIWKCIKFADMSLYQAKDTGRNKVIAFKQDMLDNTKVGDSY